jgi:hypothetical protein
METATWYVLLSSPSGHSVYATLGPFTTRELAERRARESGAVHYHVRASGPRCWEQPVREAEAV